VTVFTQLAVVCVGSCFMYWLLERIAKNRKDRAATRPKQFRDRFFQSIEPAQKSQEGAADLRPLGKEDFR